MLILSSFDYSNELKQGNNGFDRTLPGSTELYNPLLQRFLSSKKLNCSF